mgnify:CR=1 FL=1
MDRFLICENRKCRFILDRRVNGTSLDGVHRILRKCPDCGHAWSSRCPFCSQSIEMKFVAGIPHSACCGQRLRAEANVV